MLSRSWEEFAYREWARCGLSMEDNLHCTAITIDESDFEASFDQQENTWTVAWK